MLQKIYKQYLRLVNIKFTIVALIFLIVSVCVTCMGGTQRENNKVLSYTDFAGDEKCESCHKTVYESHLQTAHHLTAMPATENFIKGSFDKDKNSFYYTPSILLNMQKRDSGLYQVAYYKGEEKKAMRFDIVIGSGVMGQSYLTWRGNRLFQLPITYFTAADKWANSPGFPADRVMIDRPVTSRCLECHLTHAEGVGGTELEPVGFDAKKIIYGIGCEKCHGPAAEHVAYHQTHEKDTVAKFIVNAGKLNRQLQLDACIVCHGGNIKKTKPSFQFTAGKSLGDYFVTDSSANTVFNSSAIDVHGNQFALLKASKCFTLSNMTCGNCHNVHEKERGNLQLFSQRCISCHNTDEASFKTAAHNPIAIVKNNCIDCHMPQQTSKSIAVFLQGNETPVASKLRSHFIGIYNENTNPKK